MKNQKSVFKVLLSLLSSFYLLFSYADEIHSPRIVSLGPSLTEEMYLLNAKDNLLGCTIYAPSCAKDKDKVGTVIDVNVEKIISLKPDLILATSLTNPRQVEQLKNLGINVIIFPQAKSFEGLCSQFLRLARLIGKEKEAKNIIQGVKKQVEFIRNKTKNLKKKKVFIQVGAKPLFTAGRNSFVNDFIEFAGGENIAQDIEMGLYSREKVLKENPDVIIIVTMGIVGLKEKEIWQRYKNMNAVKNNKIFIIDSSKICSPTPLSFVETLKLLVKIFHPEIKNE